MREFRGWEEASVATIVAAKAAIGPDRAKDRLGNSVAPDISLDRAARIQEPLVFFFFLVLFA
jgi:hypothetical protein